MYNVFIYYDFRNKYFVVGQKSVKFYCKGIENKYFQFCCYGMKVVIDYI